MAKKSAQKKAAKKAPQKKATAKLAQGKRRESAKKTSRGTVPLNRPHPDRNAGVEPRIFKKNTEATIKLYGRYRANETYTATLKTDGQSNTWNNGPPTPRGNYLEIKATPTRTLRRPGRSFTDPYELTITLTFIPPSPPTPSETQTIVIAPVYIDP